MYQLFQWIQRLNDSPPWLNCGCTFSHVSGFAAPASFQAIVTLNSKHKDRIPTSSLPRELSLPTAELDHIQYISHLPRPRYLRIDSSMAARGPAGSRGANSRFAQFKLVLLGAFIFPLEGYSHSRLSGTNTDPHVQENLLLERYRRLS